MKPGWGWTSDGGAPVVVVVVVAAPKQAACEAARGPGSRGGGGPGGVLGRGTRPFLLKIAPWRAAGRYYSTVRETPYPTPAPAFPHLGPLKIP